jgi:hypothetical protein
MAGVKGHSGGRREGAGRPPDLFRVGKMIRVREVDPDGKLIGIARAMRVTQKEKRRITLEDAEGQVLLLL